PPHRLRRSPARRLRPPAHRYRRWTHPRPDRPRLLQVPPQLPHRWQQSAHPCPARRRAAGTTPSLPPETQPPPPARRPSASGRSVPPVQIRRAARWSSSSSHSPSVVADLDPPVGRKRTRILRVLINSRPGVTETPNFQTQVRTFLGEHLSHSLSTVLRQLLIVEIELGLIHRQ